MKNSLKLLSVVLLLTAGAWCQVSSTISATSTDCSVANSCLTMNLPINQSTGYSGLVVSLNPSSFSGTLTFEVSGDNGLTYTARQGYASTDNSTGVTTSTASAVSSLQFNVSGWTRFRVRASAYSSGSVVVNITPSPASASSGHGGGGGAVSSVTGAGTVSCSPTTGSVVCTGSGASAPGTTNDVPITGAGATFVADTGIFTYNPSTHILNAGQGITTSSTGAATTLGLSGGTTPGSFPTNAFGWLGPSSATFTSYFFQCPTTPPTNGQTIVFGTQVGSVVPCTYGTAGATIPSVTNLIKGDGAGNGADSGIAPANVPTMASNAAGSGNVITSAGANKTQQDSGTALSALAPLASAALTGVPTAPTATAGTNTTQLATTAFVLANVGSPTPFYSTVSNITEVAGTGTLIVALPIDTLANGVQATYDIAFTLSLDSANPGTGGTCAAGTVSVGLSGIDADTGFTYPTNANRLQSLVYQNGQSISATGNCAFMFPPINNSNSCTGFKELRRFKGDGSTPINFVIWQVAGNNCTTPSHVVFRPIVIKTAY